LEWQNNPHLVKMLCFVRMSSLLIPHRIIICFCNFSTDTFFFQWWLIDDIVINTTINIDIIAFIIVMSVYW